MMVYPSPQHISFTKPTSYSLHHILYIELTKFKISAMKYRVSRLILTFVVTWLIITGRVISQPNLHFKKLNIESGLSHSSIVDILQDHNELLWFATQYGLNRYDGYQFTKFLPIPDSTKGLRSWHITAILEDSRQYLWIGTNLEGLHKYNQATKSYKHYSIEPYPETILNISFLEEDHQGIIYVGTKRRGLYYIDAEDDKLKPVTTGLNYPRELATCKINSIMEDSQNQLWIGTQGEGLYVLNENRDRWMECRLSTAKQIPGSKNIRSLYEDSEQKIWVGTESGMFLWQKARLEFEHIPLPDYTSPRVGNVYVRAIYEDQKGIFWIGTEEGLFIYDRKNDGFTRFIHDPGNDRSISNNFISSIAEDRSGVLWFGTDNGGINYLEDRENIFQFYGKLSYAGTSDIDMHIVRCLTQTQDGSFLVGTMQNGLRYCDSMYQQCRTILPGQKGVPAHFKKKIYSIWRDQRDYLWIGTDSCLIFRYDPDLDTLILYPYTSCPTQGSLIDKNMGINYLNFYEAPNGSLWVTTMTQNNTPGGIYRYDVERDSFICWSEIYHESLKLSLQDFYSMAVDKRGIFWLGTTQGLYRFDPDSGTTRRYHEKPHNPFNRSHNHIKKLLIDQQDTLWIGTFHQLHSLDTRKPDSSWKSYQDSQNWLEGGVMSFTEDRQGNLWISTQQGIIRRSYEGKFTNYDQRDGLMINEFSMFSSYQNTQTGKIYFGGNEGFVGFHPDSIQDNTYKPKIIISSLTIYTKEDNQLISEPKTLDLVEEKTVRLGYNDIILKFDVASLNYLKNFKNQFQYRLKGLHDDWISLGTNHQITLTNLDHGNYTLEVIGSNNVGIWQYEEPASIQIIISPPWWKTHWAYALYILSTGLGLMAMYYFVKYREREKHLLQQRESELEQFRELDTQRTHFFTNISHEFRSPLTLIEGWTRNLLLEFQEKRELNAPFPKGRNILEKILDNSSHLLNLVNQLMKLAELESGITELHTSREDVVKLVQKNLTQFQSVFESKKIELKCTYTHNEMMVRLDVDKFDSIMQNLISNAIKYTPKGELIRITLQKAEAEIILEVYNAGKGIPQQDLPYVFNRFFRSAHPRSNDSEGNGIGLAIVKELVELHRGTISVNSNSKSYTSFILRLPISIPHMLNVEKGTDRIPTTKPVLTETPEMAPPKTGSNNRKDHILFVENQPEMHELIKGLLEPEFRVLEAYDINIGFEMTYSLRPDLIICDIMMKGMMDGIELCNKLKNHPQTSHIPIILLTAKTDEVTIEAGYQAGANAYITKPFKPGELKQRILNELNHVKQIKKSGIPVPEEQNPLWDLWEVDDYQPSNQAFLKKVLDIIWQNLADSDFNVNALSNELHQHRVNLYRKTRSVIA